MTATSDNPNILHIDLDCFFASVEMRDNPRLIGSPVAVGGSPQARGVIATCNYEARKFGVRSAMPSSLAMRKCPKLILLPVQMCKYRTASENFFCILYDYSEIIESVGFDEAYLDLSHHSDPISVAKEIKKRIQDELHLSSSVGVAENKFLAKTASEMNKPNGLKIIYAGQVNQLLPDQPISILPGLGPVGREKLNKLGIYTCRDLSCQSILILTQMFGRYGEDLYYLCRGRDERTLCNESMRKVSSFESTFSEDLLSFQACLEEIPALLRELFMRFQDQVEIALPSSIFIKLKFSNFKKTTAEVPLNRMCFMPDKQNLHFSQVLELAKRPLQEAYSRGQGLSVRLIGVGFRFEKATPPQELPLLRFFG